MRGIVRGYGQSTYFRTIPHCSTPGPYTMLFHLGHKLLPKPELSSVVVVATFCACSLAVAFGWIPCH